MYYGAGLAGIEYYLFTPVILLFFQELPVNLKFIFEAMEESGSKGLEKLLIERNATFFSNVDYIVISDSGWLSSKPVLTYGTRGNCYFFVEVLSQINNLIPRTEHWFDV